jgi:putative NIF3 family GTP cyclohydrolase 1 type 2
VILVGAAGSTVFAAPLTPNHVVVTGEIRHHDALTIDRYGATAIALGHFSSERPVLASLADRLRTSLPGVEVLISEHDREPFAPL